jgi:hypothetical protein
MTLHVFGIRKYTKSLFYALVVFLTKLAYIRKVKIKNVSIRNIGIDRG